MSTPAHPKITFNHVQGTDDYFCISGISYGRTITIKDVNGEELDLKPNTAYNLPVALYIQTREKVRTDHFVDGVITSEESIARMKRKMQLINNGQVEWQYPGAKQEYEEFVRKITSEDIYRENIESVEFEINELVDVLDKHKRYLTPIWKKSKKNFMETSSMVEMDVNACFRYILIENASKVGLNPELLSTSGSREYWKYGTDYINIEKTRYRSELLMMNVSEINENVEEMTRIVVGSLIKLVGKNIAVKEVPKTHLSNIYTSIKNMMDNSFQITVNKKDQGKFDDLKQSIKYLKNMVEDAFVEIHDIEMKQQNP